MTDSANKPMESVQVQVDDWIANMRAKVEKWATDAARNHAEQMANLPPGTCLYCYGDGCAVCQPPSVSAPGVPYEFQALTLDTYDARDGQHRAVQKAREFCATDGGRDVFLFGGVGTGKTRLACAMANAIHRRRRMVQFVRVPFLLHQLQPGRDIAEFEQRLLDVHVLVLDDLGAERDQTTDYTRRTLLMLYEARHDDGKRTVFTSNKSVQEIAEMQDDDRLASRIAGRADVVRVTAPDQRLARR